MRIKRRPDDYWEVKTKHIYVIAEAHEPVASKIGYTNNVMGRLAGLQNGNHRRLRCYHHVPPPEGAKAATIERMAQNKLAEHVVWEPNAMEWFMVSPSVAIKAVDEAIIEWIDKQAKRKQ